MKKIILAVFIGAFSTVSYAGCWSGGVEYSVGTVKGNMVCGADGYWHPEK